MVKTIKIQLFTILLAYRVDTISVITILTKIEIKSLVFFIVSL